MIVPPHPAAPGPPEAVTKSLVGVRVRFAETDLMGIVHHGNYLLYVEEARVEYLRRRGARYQDWIARDMHFPVVDQRIRHRAAAVFADELVVETWLGQITRVSLRFDYRILRGTQVLAEAYTTLACVDGRHRPRPIERSVLDQVLGPEVEPPGKLL